MVPALEQVLWECSLLPPTPTLYQSLLSNLKHKPRYVVKCKRTFLPLLRKLSYEMRHHGGWAFWSFFMEG